MSRRVAILVAVDLYDELLRLAEALARHGIEYALCGGMALAVHGHPRFTKDIDLLVRDEDLEKIRRAVGERGFTVEGGRIPFAAGRPEERVVHRVSKVDGREVLTLDLLVVNAQLEDVWRDRGVVELDGRKLQVVSREGLARMKRIAGRDQDLLDLKKLEEGDGGQK